MQILSKHITQTGGLEVTFLGEDYKVHAETFPAKEVQFHMYMSNMIDDAHEDQVKVIGEDWCDYIDFLKSQLADNSFCEKILSTNTLSK